MSLWAVLGLLALAPLASAQPIQNPGQDVLDEAQAEQDREDQLNARPGLLIAPSDRVPDVEDAFCFEFENINIEGVTVIRQRVLRRIVRENSSECMGQNAIAKLMEAIQNRYNVTGYITTQVLIPEQDLSQGTLNLD